MVIKKEIEKINKIIGQLVYDKVAIKKAYNYYHAKRDADQFRHLEENYGIGTPTSVTFTPLIKKHIDVLVGEYLGLNPELRIACKDSTTISNILRDKQLKINEEIHKYLSQYIQNNIIAKILEDKEAQADPFVEDEIDKIKANINESFISEYELAAQNILTYFRQSRNIDMKRKVGEIITDLLVSGTTYFRTRPTESGTNVNFQVCNPVDTFIERNPNSPYLADSRKAVWRRWMSVEDIINEYREELTDESVKKLMEDGYAHSDSDSATYLVRYTGKPEGRPMQGSPGKGILGGLEALPGLPSDYDSVNPIRNHYIPVYEVEWIEVERSTGKQTRHEGVKIGGEIYITRGESEYVIRSQDCPSKCRLTINGMFFLDKNGDPYSLMLSTMDLQDKYDLLLFFRDNLIASSGTVGDFIDMAMIPEKLGATFTDRIQKYIAYKKSGIALIDTSQEGQMMNTIFNGYDDTVKLQSIQAIQLAIQSVEQQASSITGVLPERLAQYEQRDAVSNVQLGVKMSGLLTKQYFEAMDSMYKEVNYDLLNLAKIVYKEGIQGTIILGDKYTKIFSALPEHYTMTDFDLHIEDSSKTYKDMETVKALNIEMVKANMSDPKMAVTIATADNLTELRRFVDQAMRSKQEENNVNAQLQQQVQQYEQSIKELQSQAKELQKQLQASQQKVDQYQQARLQLDQQKLALEKEKADNDRDYNNKALEVKEKQLSIQMAETVDTSPYNDKIKAVI